MSSVVAWWGAATGTASLIIKFVSVYRDRRRAVLSLSSEWPAQVRAEGDAGCLVMECRNAGHRPLSMYAPVTRVLVQPSGERPRRIFRAALIILSRRYRADDDGDGYIAVYWHPREFHDGTEWKPCPKDTWHQYTVAEGRSLSFLFRLRRAESPLLVQFH